MVGLRVSVGMYGMRLYTADAFMVLDGAWRMVNGQRPHVDFNSMIGPAAYLPTVVGFRLAANTSRGFADGQALVGLGVGIWAYWLAAKLNEFPRIVYALCVTAVAISPAELGLGPLATTPAMTYNRFAYGLLGILLLECLSTGVGSELAAGFSSGVVLGLLMFGKISAFAGAVLLIVTLVTQRTQTGRRWLGLVAGAGSVSLCFLSYLRFDVIAVVRDLTITVLSKRVVWQDYILSAIATDLLIVALVVYRSYWVLIQSGKPDAAKRLFVAGVSVSLTSLLLIFTNYQQSELPLLGLFLLIVGQRLLVDSRIKGVSGSGLRSLITTGCVILAGLTVFFATASLCATQWVALHSAVGAPRFDAPALRQFVPISYEQAYTEGENDGFRILKQYRRPGERVMSLDFSNPFSYGMWIPPAPGGSTNLQFNGSFSEHHYVSPERLFGNADLVFVPKIFTDPSLSGSVPRIYGPYLESHFELIAENRRWKLYRNRAEKTS